MQEPCPCSILKIITKTHNQPPQPRLPHAHARCFPTSWTWSCTTATIRQGRRARWTCSGGSPRSSPFFLPSPRTGSCALSGTSLRGDTPRGERRFFAHFFFFSFLFCDFWWRTFVHTLRDRTPKPPPYRAGGVFFAVPRRNPVSKQV